MHLGFYPYKNGGQILNCPGLHSQTLYQYARYIGRLEIAQSKFSEKRREEKIDLQWGKINS